MLRICSVERCPNYGAHLVSLRPWYGEDAPVRRVCDDHLEQYEIAVKNRATPQWVAVLPANL